VWRGSRKDFIKVSAPASKFRQNGTGAGDAGPTVREVLTSQGRRTKFGGPMTVVAGIVALLLLGYLVVALLKPERF
jgi:K+-transporting ATPase KdpF subunit